MSTTGAIKWFVVARDIGVFVAADIFPVGEAREVFVLGLLVERYADG
jgi:hypothetical protein